MASSIRSNGLFPRRWERSRSSSSSSSEFEEEEEVHVLAVDDSVVDRKVIEHLLKITSCKVTTVESGWRALQYLGLDDQQPAADTPPAAANHHDFVNGLKVDLIITDYCMPGMSGYELLKKIKGSPTFRQVPVVIMSSENLVPRIHRCLEEGAEDFIVKPVKLSDVKRLKDYMFGDNNSRGTTTTNEEEEEEKTSSSSSSFNKRKLQQMMMSSTSPSPPTMSPSSTPPFSPSQQLHTPT